MDLPNIEYGSEGEDVVKLQDLLNEWILRKDGNHKQRYLEPDGDFGTETKELVESYQLAMYLKKDGIVGSMTWSALLELETFNCFDLPDAFVNAPNLFQNWAGATAMALKQDRPNKTKPAGVIFERVPGGITGALDTSHENMQKFATAHDMQMLKAEALTCLQLTDLIDKFGRLMLNLKGVNSNMQPGRADEGHLVNLVGVRGNGNPDGTTITLYNPSGGFAGGRVITASYKHLKSLYPKLTYQVFYTHGTISKPIK